MSSMFRTVTTTNHRDLAHFLLAKHWAMRMIGCIWILYVVSKWRKKKPPQWPPWCLRCQWIFAPNLCLCNWLLQVAFTASLSSGVAVLTPLVFLTEYYICIWEQIIKSTCSSFFFFVEQKPSFTLFKNQSYNLQSSWILLVVISRRLFVRYTVPFLGG